MGAMKLTLQQAEAVEIMLIAGVFDVKNGSVELHFDSVGQLASVDAHQKMFRRQKISTV